MSRRWLQRAGLLVALGVLAAACSDDPSPDVAVAAATTTSGSTGTAPPDLVEASTAPAPADGPASTPATTVAPTTTSTAVGTTTTITAATTTAPPVTSAAVPLDAVQRAVTAFTGVGPGALGGGSIAIGWVNQEGGAPSFSEATVGVAAAIEYINLTLGGVQGREVQLRTCAIQREADGARCAQQLADDPAVSIVVVGVVTIGNEQLITGLRGRKPVVVATPIATSDYLATDAVAYTPGTPGIVSGLARFAAERLPGGPPAQVAVLYPYGLAGEVSYQLLAKPVLDRLGIASLGVPVVESARPSQFAPLLTDLGAASADAYLPILSTRGCIGLDQALRDLANPAPVLATDTCLGAAMSAHLRTTGRSGDLPEGWYVGGEGFRIGVPGNNDQAAYLAVVTGYLQKYGLPLLDVTTHAEASFASMLTVIRLINEVGPDQVSPDTMRTATRAFGGPVWGVAGPMNCGFNPFYPSLCGTQMGVERYTNGGWVAVADGHTGSPIELSDLVQR